jgi:polysaccharide biosynthesis/export protein
MRCIAFALSLLIVLTSCSKGNLAYLSDVSDQADFDVNLSDSYEPKIKPGDVLSITMSSQSVESNIFFNSGLLLASNNTPNTSSNNNMIPGYHVDKNGEVGLPFVGKTKLVGLTKEEATDKITKILKNYAKEPIVNIRIVNFKVTVIGEVHRPATVLIPAERLNVLEALGYAGDMTPFGRRDNVLIIRDVDGVRRTARINLNDKTLLDSPYFYLQQNDIVYVEPNKTKELQASSRSYSLPIWLSVGSLLAFVISSFR